MDNSAKVFVLALLGLLIIVFAAAFYIPHSERGGEKIQVVATIFPLYEFAKEVGGNNVEVHLLLPPGAEAHSFDPKPSDVRRIYDADIFIYTGAGMEPWAHDLVEGIGRDDLILVEASKHVMLMGTGDLHVHNGHINDSHVHEEDTHSDEGDTHSHEEDTHVHEADSHSHDHHHESEYDPHFWLDFSNDMKVVDAIAAAFSEMDPANAHHYIANAGAYKKKLEMLDEEYANGLSKCRKGTIITGGHNAFSYMAERYGFNIVSAYGISPDSEPTPKRIKGIIDIAGEHGIKYIYFESLVSPRTAEAISADAGLETMVLNPAANLKKEEFKGGATFISLMEENLINLRIGLECE